jgi:hypothetical protein
MRKLFENKLALVAMLLFTLALAWNYTHGGVALKGSHLSAAPAAVLIAHAPPMPPCDPCSVSVQIAHAPPMPPEPWGGVRISA